MKLSFFTTSSHKKKEFLFCWDKYNHANKSKYSFLFEELEIPEIQSSSPDEVIKNKVEFPFSKGKNNYIVEDTSLYIECLNGFPGPFAKFFNSTLGPTKISMLCYSQTNHPKAYAQTNIGACINGNFSFYEGRINGRIANLNEIKTSTAGYGFENFFIPDGYDSLFCDLTLEQKYLCSMRSKAVVEFFKQLK